MKKLLISRTDSIGDVVLTLPMVTWLRQCYPSAEIGFLGKSYTQAILDACTAIDFVITLEELQSLKAEARQKFIEELSLEAVIHVFPRKEVSQWMYEAKVPMRIGTVKRSHHLRYCTHRIWLSRKRSNLHEAQLNLKLLEPLGYENELSLTEVAAMGRLDGAQAIKPTTRALLSEERFNLILHPRSHGSAREWGLANFAELIALLGDSSFNIILTGTEQEGASFRNELCALDGSKVTDATGKVDLPQLVALIKNVDGLVAASTGPLHIAAAANRNALGLYIAKRPMHPGRWAPLGPRASAVVHEEGDLSLDSIEKIAPQRVAEIVKGWKRI